MSENSTTETDSGRADAAEQPSGDAPATTTSSQSSFERPASADRSGADHSLRNFVVGLLVASAVVVVLAFLAQGGLH
jgi:hypothetical protein